MFESLVTNISKEASCFSDFPFPKECTPFVSHTKFHQYLKSYATHFELEKYITFNTSVEKVEDRGPYVSCGRRWKVIAKNVVTSLCETREYDAIIVCSGLSATFRMPNIDGLLDGKFRGSVLHTSRYDTAEQFKDKNVAIIGLGNSGADIAVDISRVAKKTVLSSRSSRYYGFPRIWKKGLPTDMTTTKIDAYLLTSLPSFMTSWFLKTFMSAGFRHTTLGIIPSSLDSKHNFLTNDELPSKVLSGKVTMKPEVIKFDEDSIYYSDGTNESVDVVICATGYNSSFPFVSNDILPDKRSDMRIHNYIFPFEIPNPGSFAVIGALPVGSGSTLPPLECQARYVAQVICRIKKLPSIKTMKQEFEEDKIRFRQGKACIYRRQLGILYKDRIAKLGGFLPGFLHLLLRDPKLALRVYFGPFLSYHYRLVGCHQWKEARARIFNVIPNNLFAINRKRS